MKRLFARGRHRAKPRTVAAISASLLMVAGAVAIALESTPNADASGPRRGFAAPPLKVVTYNICGQSKCQSKLSPADWSASLTQAITAYNPDVVDLQEVCQGQADLLTQALPGYQVRYLKAVALKPDQKGCLKWGGDGTSFGAALLVRAGQSPTFYSQVLYPVDAAKEPRPLICAKAINADWGDYLSCNVHLDGGVGGLRSQGVPQVLNRLQFWGRGIPTILAGDFNADPGDPNLGALYQAQDGIGAFVEADETARDHFTPACRPLAACRSGRVTTLPAESGRKFDYIFAGAADFVPGLTETLDVRGRDGSSLSDHQMYRTELRRARDTGAPATPTVQVAPTIVRPGNDWANAVDRTAGNFTAGGTADMVLRFADGTVRRYPSNADGTFGAGRQLAAGWSQAAGITAGDFTGSGNGDLLVRWNSGNVTFYPGDGRGALLTSSVPLLPVDSWTNAAGVAFAHVFGATSADLIVRWNDGRITVQTVAKAAGGAYAMSAPVALTLAGTDNLTNAADLVAGDFDGNGTSDVLVRDTAGGLTLYPGDGRGGFPTAVTGIADGRNWAGFTPVPAAGRQYAAAEDFTAGAFTTPGRSDLVVRWSNQYAGATVPGQGQIELLKATGTTPTAFEAPKWLKSAYTNTWTTSAGTFVADVNGDGKADLLNRRVTGPAAGSLTYAPSDGKGGFGADKTLGIAANWGPQVLDLAVGDVNGDGAPDVLARESGGALLYPGTPGQPGVLQPAGAVMKDVDWTTVADVVTAPFRGTRYSDVVVRHTDGRATLHAGSASGIGPATVLGTPSGPGWRDATGVYAGEFTGDGKADLLVRDRAGAAQVHPGDGSGGFGVAQPAAAAGSTADLAGLGQGTVLAAPHVASNVYHRRDGSVSVDVNGTTNLVAAASSAVGGPTARFTLRSSDVRAGVGSFEYRLDGGAPVVLSALHGSLDLQLSDLPTGRTHSLTVVAIDTAGNRSPAATHTFTN
ncbi:endonuclease/exonuclease/phosphatase family protein [Embleya sp. NPDC005575]|uniref:endonuclease/exonuclease/phosphatase family protein n=1 Tax=Embleya sp. NPDC005575 TaxID=3156892 RepID=UPI0033A1B3B0